MVRTVKVLNALVVFLTEQTVDAFLVLEVDVAQNRITLDNFIQDVEVQRKLVDGLDLLHQLMADGAPDTEVVVQASQTLRAEGVSAMDENARYLLADVEFVAAKVAEVKATGGVVSLNDLRHGLLALFSFLPVADNFRFLAPLFQFNHLQYYRYNYTYLFPGPVVLVAEAGRALIGNLCLRAGFSNLSVVSSGLLDLDGWTVFLGVLLFDGRHFQI